jgi:hypothetical protein
MIGVLSVIGVLLAGVLWLYVYARWFYAPGPPASNQQGSAEEEIEWMC